MNAQDIIIILSFIIISSSGIIINIIKKGDSSKDEVKDGNTLFWFRILVPLALVFSVALYFMKIGTVEFPSAVFYIGSVLIVFGLLMRWYSIWYIGKAFTVQVKIVENHELITSGIYKKIRHPSYTGLLMYYLGLGLVMENYVCLSLLLVAPIIAVLYRIQLEEGVLLGHFKQAYQTYQKRSWRLIPFVY